jgi:hypothetical protein
LTKRDIRKIAAALCTSMVLPSFCPAVADSSTDMMSLQLADLLSSESFCGLSYDQDAIKAFINTHVAADDLKFTVVLQLDIAGDKFAFKDMSPSDKTAHCTQIARVARSYNFIK